MNLKSDIAIALLELHRDRLQASNSFEDYKAAHISYVQMLIDRHKAEKAGEKAIMDWVEKNFS